MRIATFNVNSVRARIGNLTDWLRAAAPDVVLLQELKCQDDEFPLLEIAGAGYRAVVHGQKTYNGVAILAREPLDIADVTRGLPGDDGDTQARYIEATIGGVRIASLYLPNGNPAPGDKYDYKLRWMDRLIAHGRRLLDGERPVVLGGDYNICPTDDDLYDAEIMKDDALCRPEARARFRALCHLGFYEAFRTLHPTAVHQYSYWDYQAGALQKDNGLRIDHFLVSPQAADRLVSCAIDKTPRAKEKASDHTPVIVELDVDKAQDAPRALLL